MNKITDTSNGARPTVLTIEDEPDISGLITDEFSEAGLDVVQVPNGQVGLFMAREFRPKVIIVDLMMPEMSGIQFMPHLNPETTADSTVIVVTAINQPAVIKACHDAGASIVADKPFHLEELSVAVRNADNMKPQ